MPLYPALYQINPRIVLGELAQQQRLNRPATLDDFPDAYFDKIADLGFDWVWLLGVWQTGPESRKVAQTAPEMLLEYQRVLPVYALEDIVGSPFALSTFQVHTDFGGNAALARLRNRLAKRGLKLLLDFVPNHLGLDHPWASSHPEYFIVGTPADLEREPRNYIVRSTKTQGQVIFAHGRDPYFLGWGDTLQLNYRHPGLRRAMQQELLTVATLCDGVRCDMAMLLLPEVIQKTWGDLSLPSDGAAPVDTSFWLEAIPAVRAIRPGFLFMAEVYWDLEWVLQQQGFDATYDKSLYDRLRSQSADRVRPHLWADLEFAQKSVRFLENHDEPRAAETFPPGVHEAAAVATFFLPGLRFIHEGQLEGRRIRVPIQLRRRPDEPVNHGLYSFYTRLLGLLKRSAAHNGQWRLLNCRSAWENNPTHQQFLAYLWEAERQRLLVVVNYGPQYGQCYVETPLPSFAGRMVHLADLLGSATYDRDGSELNQRGLYMDLAPWGYHAFDITG